MHRESASEVLEAQAHIWNQSQSFANTELLYTALELGIPDIIHNHGKPMTLTQLVESLQINPTKINCVYRLMKVLTYSGYFVVENTDGNEEDFTYKLTKTSNLLLKDNPLGMAPLVRLAMNPMWRNSWRTLSQWLKNNDDTSFRTANGRSFFDYISQDPNLIEEFNKSMACEALVTAYVIIEKKKEIFDGLRSLVDVGGGDGSMLKAFSEELPNLKKVVFDLPHVVANLEESDNLSFVGGDMFEAVPCGDAILLKRVLHDWSDENCVKILKQCKRSIPSKDEGGKVLIIDIVMGDCNGDREVTESQMICDMSMMVYFMSKERNEKEWENIFTEAGFSGYKIHSILGLRSLIEVYP